jgi:peptide/nickel transport system substrate-binding protein
VGWCSEPDTLNPLSSYSTESKQITNLVYEPLIGYGTDLQYVYKLAKSFEYSADGKSVTYHLQENVKWQDGEPFTSADVAFTYNLIKDTGLSEAAQFLENLESVETPDDLTVVMNFTAPQAFNCAPVILILPKHIWDGMSASDIEAYANDNPVGTGAFKFKEWTQGATVTLERNDNYYGKKPAASSIIYILYGNEDVLVQALKAGEVDVIPEVSPTVWESLKGEANIKAAALDSFSFHQIGINMDSSGKSLGNPMLLDKEVRRALNFVADRAKITDIALAGHGKPGSVLMPNGLKEWQYQVTDAEKMDGSIDQAKAILEAAGYKDTDGDGIREKDGKKMDFRIIANEATSVDVRAAQLFRDSAKEAGINLTLTTVDENTLGGIVYNKEAPDYDLYVWGWDSEYPDPSYLLGIALTNQVGINNELYYRNPEYDKLYSQQSMEMDKEKRKQIINAMQKMFYDDGGYIILWYQDKLQAYRTDKWTGWVECPGGLIYGVTYENYLNVEPLK